MKDKAIVPNTLTVSARHEMCFSPEDLRLTQSGDDPKSLVFVGEQDQLWVQRLDPLIEKSRTESTSPGGHRLTLMKETEEVSSAGYLPCSSSHPLSRELNNHPTSKEGFSESFKKSLIDAGFVADLLIIKARILSLGKIH